MPDSVVRRNDPDVRDALPAPTRPLEWTELPDPRPGPHEVLIRVLACGVCRSPTLARAG
jgi:D-arabinose 1-dehydrogenase-like Zn-dependent alcohol dehydrogenase